MPAGNTEIVGNGGAVGLGGKGGDGKRTLGTIVGLTVVAKGDLVGVLLGARLGNKLGKGLGMGLGAAETGEGDDKGVGLSVDAIDGIKLGEDDNAIDGTLVGRKVGE
jgi:hypothetical protein